MMLTRSAHDLRRRVHRSRLFLWATPFRRIRGALPDLLAVVGVLLIGWVLYQLSALLAETFAAFICLTSAIWLSREGTK